ncbi:MAG: hypothetical protein WA130_19850 [Candidatus Methanoperedens sp.]
MQPVSSITNIGQVNLRYDSVGFVGSLSPVIWFRLMLTGMPRTEQQQARPEELMVSDIKGQLLLSDGIRIGSLTSEKPYINLYRNNEHTLELYIELDHYKLHQIEKFRKGSELVLQMNINFIVEKQGQPQNKEIGSFNNLRFEIPKSEWVEKILPNIGFKDVSLIELPKINPQWQKIIEHINEAWHQHSMGKYDKVLTESRKALESLADEVKRKGFVKTIKNDKDEEKTIPDWKRFFNSEHAGDTIGAINQKFNGFLSASAHVGKAINREDADFALLVTHGMVTLVTENLMKKTEELQ